MGPLKNDAWRNRSSDRSGSINLGGLTAREFGGAKPGQLHMGKVMGTQPYHEGVDQPVNLVLCSVFDTRGAMASEPTDSGLGFLPSSHPTCGGVFQVFSVEAEAVTMILLMFPTL